MRRGSDYDRKPTVLDEGEPGWTTDTCRLYVGDGRKEGGYPVVNIRTEQNTPAHIHNNDLIYEPIDDITGYSQPPTQHVLAINHPGLSGSLTKLWLDDRYLLRDPCESNSLANPPDSVVCAPGSGLFPKQTMKTHLQIIGTLAVSGVADFCEAHMLVNSMSGCELSDGRIDIQGSALNMPTGPTSKRPQSPELGDVRYNTDTDKHEAWNGSNWGTLGGDTTTLFINGDDLMETTNDAGLAAANPAKYLLVDPTLQSIGIQESTSTNPFYLYKVEHNTGSLFIQATVFDDYRRVVIPDDIYMLDENTCYINLASFVTFPSPGTWELPSSGPGPIISTWTPPGGTPPLDKKWTILTKA